MESEQMYGDKGQVPEEEYLIPIGQAEVKKEGSDVTVVSFGKILKEVFKASEKLTEDNINIEIIDLRTLDLLGLDWDCIGNSLKKTNRVLIAEQTTKGTSLSILKNEELSITIHLFLLAIGANFFDTSEPAENKAMSALLKSKSSNFIFCFSRLVIISCF